jgi:transcriptional regulator with XRE-family HTH domain
MPQNETQLDPVSQAIRAVRLALGESQQAFAYRMKTAIRTIARYETTRAPRGAELAQFHRLAVAQGFREQADVFAKAMEEELEMRAESIPRTLEEQELLGLLFLIMRNRDRVPGLDQGFRAVREALLRNFDLIEKHWRKSKKVLGIGEDEMELMKGEVRAIRAAAAKEAGNA